MPGSQYVTAWCKRCQVHLAVESEGFICPVCRDEQRRHNSEVYK